MVICPWCKQDYNVGDQPQRNVRCLCGGTYNVEQGGAVEKVK